jgi:hypothetical protein
MTRLQIGRIIDKSMGGMLEHIHLLISEPQQNWALRGAFSRRPRRKRDPATHLAETVLRFQRLDGTEAHREISLHASQSGAAWLVLSPELWGWSSFRSYFLGEDGPVKVKGWKILKMKIQPPAA